MRNSQGPAVTAAETAVTARKAVTTQTKVSMLHTLDTATIAS
ncbi:MAG: hypothetical protein ACR2OB_12265 [Solirubrobacteraceae bacterium]